MNDESELLRRYADERAEAAFAEIVQRHIGLVYHAALRQAGDASLAEDVTQTVFADLARKAGALAGRASIPGWLYTSTRFAATKARRGEQRRRAREQEVFAIHEATTGTAMTDWAQLRPVIDEALHALEERDREAVLLRFFEGRSLAAVGGKLAVSEDTAQVRLARALAANLVKDAILDARRPSRVRGAVRVEDWQNRGTATPSAALEGYLWAVDQVDVDVTAMTIGFGEWRPKMDALFATLSEAVRAKYDTPEKLWALVMPGAPHGPREVSFELLAATRDSSLPNSDNYRSRRVRTVKEDGRIKRGDIQFERTPDEWRRSLDDRAESLIAPMYRMWPPAKNLQDRNNRDGRFSLRRRKSRRVRCGL